jgi:hypothetical protein
LTCISDTRWRGPIGNSSVALTFTSASFGIAASSLLESAAALRHVHASRVLGLLRRLRPVPA